MNLRMQNILMTILAVCVLLTGSVAYLQNRTIQQQAASISSIRQQLAQQQAQPAPAPAPSPTAPTPSVPATQNGWSTYSNTDLHFQMSEPSEAMTATTNDRFDQQQYGRIGIVTEGIQSSNELLNAVYGGSSGLRINIYSNKATLEKDFTVSGSFMGGLGLHKTTMVINGQTSDVYYGANVVEGLGEKAYNYVAAEIIGPTYAYLVEFFNYSADPNDTTIKNYLSSFVAN